MASEKWTILIYSLIIKAMARIRAQEALQAVEVVIPTNQMQVILA